MLSVICGPFKYWEADVQRICKNFEVLYSINDSLIILYAFDF